MSRFHRKTTPIWYSIACNYLWILLLALWTTQCKPLSHSYRRGHINGANTGTDNSQFDSNVNHLLDDLVRNTPMTGFNVSLYGESPNMVLGFLQCRGDASEAECSDCCQGILKQSTPTGSLFYSHTWYDMCELFYENYSSPILPADAYDFEASCNGSLPITDPTGLQNLLYNLSDEATRSSKKFAKGSSVDSSGQQIYGLVQCYIGLSIDECSTCLSQAFLTKVVDLGLGSHVYMGRCYFIISNEPTYSNNTCTSPTGNHSRKLYLNWGIVGSMLVVLVLLLL